MSDNADNRELKELLKWSIKLQQNESSPGTPMDPERMQFLKDVLAEICNQPSETDLMKAALAVLKVNYSTSLSGSCDSSQLEEAFEQLQYFIEDIDHANDLLPLGGVEVLLQYLDHSNHRLIEMSCGAIATACQNNMKCQEVFYSAVPRLLAVMEDGNISAMARTKALSAVSCIARDFPPGREMFFKNGGISIITNCLDSGIDKLVAKALFLMSYFYKTGSEGAMKEECGEVLCRCVKVLDVTSNVQVVLNSISLLNTVIATCGIEYRQWKEKNEELVEKLKTSASDKSKQFDLQAEDEVVSLMSCITTS